MLWKTAKSKKWTRGDGTRGQNQLKLGTQIGDREMYSVAKMRSDRACFRGDMRVTGK